MKRFVSFLIVAALLISMIPAVFAEETTVAAGTDEAVTDAGKSITWTAPSDGTLTMHMLSGDPAWYFRITDLADWNFPGDGEDTISYEVAASSSYTITVGAYSWTDFAPCAGTVSYEILFTPAAEAEWTETAVSGQQLTVGENSVILKNAKTTICSFTPDETGIYTVTAPEGVELGYWGSTATYLIDSTENKTNTLEVEIASVGQTALIGLTYESDEPVAITIAKTGDVEVAPEIEVQTYENKHTPSEYTLPADAVIGDYVNVLESHAAVPGYDGYYHLDSVDGPVLLVDLDHLQYLDYVMDQPDAMNPQVHAFVLKDGAVVEEYDVLAAFREYKEAADENGYYPLTEDLIFFYQGFAVNSAALPQYLIELEEGQSFDMDTLWMYDCLTVELPVPELELGDNEIEIPSGSELYYATFTATETGTLYIVGSDLWLDFGEGYEDYNSMLNSYWSWYTRLTVNGEALSDHYYGSIDVVAGETYHFAWKLTDTYFQLGFKANLNLSYTNENVPVPGLTDQLPIMLNYEDVPTDTIEIPAGGCGYYEINYYGAVTTITGENLYVENYGETYYPVDGVVTLENVGGLIVIHNTGDTAAVFHIEAAYPAGSPENPRVAEDGANEVEITNTEEHYMVWTADCNGTVTLTVSGLDAWYGGWELYLPGSEEADESGWLGSADSDTVTVDVMPGAKLVFYFAGEGAWNEDYTLLIQPSGTMTATVTPTYEHTADEGTYHAGTCTTNAYTEHTCTVCGERYTVEHQDTKAPHTPDEGTHHDATCTGDAYTEHNCAVCGESFTVVEEDSALGHDFVDGTCTRCGAAEYALGDVNRDGQVDIRDAVMVASAYNELIVLDEDQKLLADVNHDGEVNILDAVMIASLYNEVITEFPAAG